MGPQERVSGIVRLSTVVKEDVTLPFRLGCQCAGLDADEGRDPFLVFFDRSAVAPVESINECLDGLQRQ